MTAEKNNIAEEKRNIVIEELDPTFLFTWKGTR